MDIPFSIEFIDLPKSQIQRTLAQDKLRTLQRVYDRIQDCHVTVDVPHRHATGGRHYVVQLRVEVPGATLVASSDPNDPGAEDACNAIRNAFNTMRRQLSDFAQKQRGEVKTHAAA